MKALLIALVLAGILAGGYYFRLHSRILPLLSSVGGQPEPKQEDTVRIGPTKPITREQVAGVSTERLGEVTKNLAEAGLRLGKSATAILFSDATDSATKIQLSSVTSQIQQRVDAIPSQLLEQAKVAYCTQVLIEATKSATSH